MTPRDYALARLEEADRGLRYARVPRPGLLATINPKAQINRGFYPSLDEGWGSRHEVLASGRENASLR
jgi:hypothetical protein